MRLRHRRLVLDKLRRSIYLLVSTRVMRMAEISQLDRVRSLARTVVADVGIRPRGGGRIRADFPIA